jgi:hypothetical protein
MWLPQICHFDVLDSGAGEHHNIVGIGTVYRCSCKCDDTTPKTFPCGGIVAAMAAFGFIKACACEKHTSVSTFPAQFVFASKQGEVCPPVGLCSIQSTESERGLRQKKARESGQRRQRHANLGNVDNAK